MSFVSFASLPGAARHWRRIATPQDERWADLNAPGTLKFSDADFPPFLGWQCINDDPAPDDQHCGSTALRTLLARSIPDMEARTHALEKTSEGYRALARQIENPKVRSRLHRLICNFPSEFDFNTFDARYAHVKDEKGFKDSPDNWPRFRDHGKALCPNDLPKEYLDARWRVHPTVFIEHMRKCPWLQPLDLTRIFTRIEESHREQVRNELNRISGKYFLNTPLRLAHFFGQIRQEAGADMADVLENLNYSAAVLKIKFRHYINNPAEADQDGHVDGAAGHPANQQAIANKAYAQPQLGNIQPGDGWRYRGRGMKQVTGKANYQDFSAQYNKYWAVGWQDFEAHPDLLTELPYSLRSAVWFWASKGCMKPADRGITDNDVDQVTAIVNSGELGKRQSNGAYRPQANRPALSRRRYAKNAYKALA